MIIDLTKRLDASFTPYAIGDYSDPPFTVSPWSSIGQEGFCVSGLSMGTQTGTHIDAPAHFLENGATLDTLAPEACLGKYFLLDLPQKAGPVHVGNRLSAYRQENILLIRTPENAISRVSGETVKKVLSLAPLLIVLSGEIETEGDEPFTFNRLVAAAGKFLAEDLDQKAAQRLTENGEIFVLPLRLTGVSGSPCRIVAKTGES